MCLSCVFQLHLRVDKQSNMSMQLLLLKFSIKLGQEGLYLIKGAGVASEAVTTGIVMFTVILKG